MSAVLEKEPGDDEPVTHGQLRRLINVFEPQLAEMRKLCFEDEVDAAGKMVRPSLSTVSTTIHNHIQAMCLWARAIKWGLTAIASIGGALAGIHATLSFLGIFHL